MNFKQSNPPGLWDAHLKQWQALGPPLRPAAEDISFMQYEVDAWSERQNRKAATVLVLGVTPEFPALHWPSGSRVYATDRSLGMIHHVWPDTAEYAAGAINTDWRMPPFEDSSADVIIGDGCFTLIDWPDGHQRLLQSIAEILRPGGRLLARFFVRPEVPESPETIFTDLTAGQIGNFHIFKWRLVMSLYDRDSGSVRLAEVWDAWNTSGLTDNDVAEITAWPVEVIRTIHAYRDLEVTFAFPTLAELREITQAIFTETACHIPAYEIGARCPIIALER